MKNSPLDSKRGASMARREFKAKGFTGVFTVEENEGYQAVYPAELSDLSSIYGTETAAWNAIKRDCMDRNIVLIEARV